MATKKRPLRKVQVTLVLTLDDSTPDGRMTQRDIRGEFKGLEESYMSDPRIVKVGPMSFVEMDERRR
jgi:hypothetical protein